MEEEYQIQKTLLYVGDEGEVSLDVIVDHKRETFWTTQKTMAELFNVNKSSISRHLSNIFEDGELDADSVVANFATTASDGKKYKTNFYNWMLSSQWVTE